MEERVYGYHVERAKKTGGPGFLALGLLCGEEVVKLGVWKS